jgi:hypothetical protein
MNAGGYMASLLNWRRSIAIAVMNHMREISYGRFHQNVLLPDPLDIDAARTFLKKGMQWIDIPKIPQAEKKFTELQVTLVTLAPQENQSNKIFPVIEKSRRSARGEMAETSNQAIS